MSKRKVSASIEDEFNRLSKKIRKLEKRIRVSEDTIPQQTVTTEPDPGEGPSSQPSGAGATCSPPSPSTPPPDMTEHDILELSDQECDIPATDEPRQDQVPVNVSFYEQDCELQNMLGSQPSNQVAMDVPVMATNDKTETMVTTETADPVVQLDEDILEILGDDPTSTVKYGPDIRTELTSRFQHIATQGLSKENRKELVEKYPLPANCLQVGAPTINPEIKAALTDSILKRDKGIEAKQKEMASAISGLTDIISLHLNSKDKNNPVLQKLMDVSRILCDIQHGDSVTRRNFILFAVKNDMQEHLKITKIDTFLFGENLSDTLKSAKAVNKTGDDLKVADANKSQSKKAKPPASQPLNRKAAAPPRRGAGAAAPALRGRTAPPPYRAHYPPPPPPPPPAYRASSMPPPPPPYRRRY